MLNGVRLWCLVKDFMESNERSNEGQMKAKSNRLEGDSTRIVQNYQPEIGTIK